MMKLIEDNLEDKREELLIDAIKAELLKALLEELFGYVYLLMVLQSTRSACSGAANNSEQFPSLNFALNLLSLILRTSQIESQIRT